MYKRRCLILLLGFLSTLMLIYIKIVKLQYKSADELKVIADSQYQYTEKFKELNYDLLDCKGRKVLKYNKNYKAVVVPSAFLKNNYDKDDEEVLKLVYILKNYNNEYNLYNMNWKSKSEKVCFDIDDITYNKLKKLKKIKGFYAFEYFELADKTNWNIVNMLVSTINFSDSSLKSKDSLESQIHNNTKNNKKNNIAFNLDMNGNIDKGTIVKNDNDKDVKLTIDNSLQKQIKDILNSKYNKYRQIGVTLIESDTGKIRAMVQKNDSLPNVNIGAETLNGFFPGSIFKTIVFEGVLEQNKLDIHKKYLCKGNFESKDHNHGVVDINKAYVKSCNDVFSRLGINVGFNKINDLCKKQGIFNKVLGLEKEQIGKLEVKNPKAEDGTLGSMSIGQNIRITPIEAISIINTVVNKGIYVKPSIIDSYINQKGEILDKTDLKHKKIISIRNANRIKNSMKEVVKEGTGKMAFTSKTEVGGKTGTTERVEGSSDKNKKEFSDGWFGGYFKYNNKDYSMIVFVENISKDIESGGTTAAPIFKDIVNKIVK